MNNTSRDDTNRAENKFEAKKNHLGVKNNVAMS